jgi:hypothetical protein
MEESDSGNNTIERVTLPLSVKSSNEIPFPVEPLMEKTVTVPWSAHGRAHGVKRHLLAEICSTMTPLMVAGPVHG